MMNKLRELNNALLLKYAKENDIEQVIKHNAIKELLKKDDCFLHLTMPQARTILMSLNLPNWQKTYTQLIKK